MSTARDILVRGDVESIIIAGGEKSGDVDWVRLNVSLGSYALDRITHDLADLVDKGYAQFHEVTRALAHIGAHPSIVSAWKKRVPSVERAAIRDDIHPDQNPLF